MKVVVTGGNGYIGARLCNFLADHDYKVIPVCFPQIPQNKNWIDKMHSIIVGDLRSMETITEISKIKPEAIIHLVSLDHYQSEHDPEYVLNINVTPTWQLLNKFAVVGLRTFIYFSTIHVYGKNQKGLTTEQTKPAPANAYGLTHFLSEEICNYYNKNSTVNCINVRLSNSYGEPFFEDVNCWELVINNLCLRAYNEKRIVLKSNGKAWRDFIHYSTICTSIQRLLLRDIKFDKKNTVHISSGMAITLLEAAEMVSEVYRELYNSEIEIYINNNELFNKKSFRSMPDYTISNDYIRTLIKYDQFPLKEGIMQLFRFLETKYPEFK